MPYAANRDLPVRVRRHLPRHAQSIFREAFNHAWQQYAHDPRREEIAFRVAWSAVKRQGYHRADGAHGEWVEGAPRAPAPKM